MSIDIFSDQPPQPIESISDGEESKLPPILGYREFKMGARRVLMPTAKNGDVSLHNYFAREKNPKVPRPLESGLYLCNGPGCVLCDENVKLDRWHAFPVLHLETRAMAVMLVHSNPGEGRHLARTIAMARRLREKLFTRQLRIKCTNPDSYQFEITDMEEFSLSNRQQKVLQKFISEFSVTPEELEKPFHEHEFHWERMFSQVSNEELMARLPQFYLGDDEECEEE